MTQMESTAFLGLIFFVNTSGGKKKKVFSDAVI